MVRAVSGYEVFGGSVAASVVTPELREAASRLRSASGHLDAAAGANAVLSGSLDPSVAEHWTPGLVPSTDPAELVAARHQVRSRFAEVASAGVDLQRHLLRLSEELVRAAELYDAAERGAIQDLGARCSVPSGPVGRAAVAELVRGFREEEPPGQAVAAEAIAAALGLGGEVGPGENGAQAQERAARVMTLVAWLLERRGSQAGDIAIGIPQELRTDRLSGLTGMIDLQAAAMRGTDGSGALVVTRFGPVEGEDTWVVTVPGTNTEEGSVWGVSRLPEAIGSQLDHVAPAVQEALESVGVPDGARLVLNGHSQGGRHALNLARDPGLGRRYRISGVVTAGAPSGNVPARDGMSIIQLEDPEDPVPGLDGSTYVTPTRDRFLVRGLPGKAPIPAGQEPGIFGQEHKSANYRALAAQVQADAQDSDLSRALFGLGIGAGVSTTARSWVVPTTAARDTERKKGVSASGRDPGSARN